MEIECRDREEEIFMRHILKEVNQVSLFSPFFLYSFSNNHLEV